jgi:hypothetical protein
VLAVQLEQRQGGRVAEPVEHREVVVRLEAHQELGPIL